MNKRILQIVSLGIVLFAWLIFAFLGKGNNKTILLYSAVFITLLAIITLIYLQKKIKNNDTPSISPPIVSNNEQKIEPKIPPITPQVTPAHQPPRASSDTVALYNPTVALSRRIYLLVDSEEDRIVLDVFPITIGRGKILGSYKFTDSTISRNHAKLEEMADQYSITDLGSKNGTLVNGSPLDPHISHLLNNGDLIRMGRTELTFIAEI